MVTSRWTYLFLQNHLNLDWFTILKLSSEPAAQKQDFIKINVPYWKRSTTVTSQNESWFQNYWDNNPTCHAVIWFVNIIFANHVQTIIWFNILASCKIVIFFQWSPPTDFLSDTYSDIISSILSDIYSDMVSGIFSGIYIYTHIFWHSVWHSIWHSV